MTENRKELTDAGALVDAKGLHRNVQGLANNWSGGRKTVTDGPFAATQDFVADSTVSDAPSREAAVEWASRFPSPGVVDGETEVRQFFNVAGFGDVPGIDGASASSASPLSERHRLRPAVAEGGAPGRGLYLAVAAR